MINGDKNWSGKWTKEWYGISRFFEKLEKKSYKMHIRVFLSRYRSYSKCPVCDGTRLKTESLHWKILNKDISQWLKEPITTIDNWIKKLKTQRFNGKQKIINFASVKVLLKEIETRLEFCKKVGLGYLTLDRQSRTLSGGEVQRINLTTALGTSLVNTLFVLDEPSIGLHSRDIENLIKVIKEINKSGNTILLVEHDPQVISACDHIIELGPGPGEKGGQISFQGSYTQLLNSDSITAKYLNHKMLNHPNTELLTKKPNKFLTISDGESNNIKDLNLSIPLESLCCITGVSGSGKSTLIQNILLPAISSALADKKIHQKI